MLFRYWAARWKHPGASAARFIRSGLGLETRARWLSAFWSEHLSRTRAAQARWARTAQGDTLTVIGAGPLLDLNIPALSARFRRFRLVDANPMVVSEWTRIAAPVEPIVTDVTGCVETWLEQIKRTPKKWPETLEVLKGLAQKAMPAYSVSTDGLISLNILSQLDVGWQEAVEPLLHKRFGKRFVQQHEQEWLAAIAPASRTLIEQHLAALEASGAKHVLLITDLEYVEYTGRLYQRRHFESPPLQWTADGWQSEAGIRFEVQQALESVSMSEDTFQTWLPSYRLIWHENWLWHIGPNGTESAKAGKLHRVGAFAFVQRSAGEF